MIHIVPVLTDNYCYLLEGEDKKCIIIDPGDNVPVENAISALGLIPCMILNTHHHGDHTGGNVKLSKKYGIPVMGPKGEQDKIPAITNVLAEGDIISEHGIVLTVIETPGHTKNHIIFHWKDAGALFTGDTLFSMGCGRLIEDSAEAMYSSLQKIKSYPMGSKIFCGHEYTLSNARFAVSEEPENIALKKRLLDVEILQSQDQPTIPVTLETEFQTNPFLRAATVKEFAGLRARKDIFH